MSIVGEAVVRVRADSGGLTEQVSLEGSRAGRAFSAAFNRSSKGAFGNVEKELNQTTRGALAGSGAFMHLGRSLAFASTTFLGTASAINLVRSSIQGVAVEQKQIERTNTLFLDGAKSVRAFADQAVTSLGLVDDQTLKMANDLGQMLIPLGVAPKSAAALSVELTKLIGNLSSMRGEAPEEVLTKIEAGLRGRGMGLKAYGIVLDETRLKAEALRQGIVKSTVDEGKAQASKVALAIAQAKLAKAESDFGANTTQVLAARQAVTAAEGKMAAAVAGSVPALTQQQKSLAAVQIILQQGTRYQGEFAKHADDLANKERVLNAQIDKLKDTLGYALLPSIQHVVGGLSDWLAKDENMLLAQRKIQTAVRETKDVFSAAWAVISTGVKIIRPVVDAVGGLKNTIELLIALKIALWVNGVLAPALARGALAWAGIGTAATVAAAETTTATAVIVADEAAITAGATVAAGRVATIGLAFTKMLGPIAIAAAAIYSFSKLMDNLFPAEQATAANIGSLPGDLRRSLARKLTPAQRAQLGIDANGNPVALSAAGQAAAAGAGQGAASAVFGGETGGAVGSFATKFGPGSGITYSWGGVSPQTGFDCSGYIYAAYKAAGITIPRDTRGQWNDPNAIDATGQERVGDGVYFVGSLSGKNAGPPPGHAGIYIGGGKYIEYFSQGKPAKVSYLGGRKDYMGARRWIKVLSEAGGSGTPAGNAGPAAGAAGAGAASLVVGAKAGASDITAVPPALRTAIARADATPGLRDDLAAQKTLLQLYLDRLKKKGLSAAEKADLEEAKSAVQQKIRDIQGQIDQAAADEAKKEAAARAHESLVQQVVAGILPVSAMATRASEVVGAAFEKLTSAVLKAKLAAQAKARARIAALAKTTQAGVTEATDVIGSLLGLDPSQTVTTQDKWGRAVVTTIGAIVVKAQKALRDMNAALANKTGFQAAIDEWEALGPQLSAAIGASLDAAAEVVRARNAAFETTFGSLSSRILTAFDRETQSVLGGMQQGLNDQISGLQTQLASRLEQMQADLARKVAQITAKGALLTASEQALKALQLQAGGDTATADLQAAHAALLAAKQGSPEALAAQKQIDALMLQQKINGLQTQADAERAARDRETQAQIDALTEREKAREEELRAEEAALEESLRREETLREQNYQDERDARRVALDAQLADWQKHLEDGSAKWSDFTDWLKGEGVTGDFGPNPVVAMTDAGQTQGSAFAQAYIAELQAAYAAQQALANGQDPAAAAAAARASYGSKGGTGHGIGHLGFLGGGEIPGPYTGRDDKFALVSGGETVIDTKLTDALKRVFLGGQQGGKGMDVLAELLFESLAEHRKQTALLGRPLNISANGRTANDITFEASR